MPNDEKPAVGPHPGEGVLRRRTKPITGVGAGLFSASLLYAVAGGLGLTLFVGLIGALMLGVGVATEWND